MRATGVAGGCGQLVLTGAIQDTWVRFSLRSVLRPLGHSTSLPHIILPASGKVPE